MKRPFLPLLLVIGVCAASGIVQQRRVGLLREEHLKLSAELVSNGLPAKKPRGRNTFADIVRNQGAEDFDSVARRILEKAPTLEEKVTFANELPSFATDENTGRWLEWMSSNLPADRLAEPVAALVREWTRQDYQAAGNWLAAAPESPVKHAAVLAYAGAVAEYEPQVAGQWAMTLPPGPVREEALKTIYQNWPVDDPVGAAAFAREHGMD